MVSNLARFIIGALVLLLLVVGSALTADLMQTHREYREFKNTGAEAAARLETMRAERDRKEAYLRLMLSDERFLERVVREKLGYVRPDETVFRFDGRR